MGAAAMEDYREQVLGWLINVGNSASNWTIPRINPTGVLGAPGIPNSSDHFGIVILWDSHRDKDAKASHAHTEGVSRPFHAPDPTGAAWDVLMCPKPRKRGTKGSRDLQLEGLSCPIPKKNQDFPRKQLFFLHF